MPSDEFVNGLSAALLDAFTLDGLDLVLHRRLGISLEREVGTAGRGLKFIVPDLVRVAQREGWFDDLYQAALLEHPNSPGLRQFAQRHPLSVRRDVSGETGGIPENVGSLEKLVRERGVFLKWNDFTRKLSSLGRQLCRIEIPESAPAGTGWLVGADLVLTAYHVVEDIVRRKQPSDSVRCRFDFFAEPGAEAKTQELVVGLSKDWCVYKSPYSDKDVGSGTGSPSPQELDFALIRLGRRIGDDVVDGARRGWIRASATPPVASSGDILVIPQHPATRSLELAFGTVGNYNDNGTRLRHDANTEQGSSGSPCLAITLEPFGLHHAAGSVGESFNQCIPLRRIIEELRGKPGAAFWES